MPEPSQSTLVVTLRDTAGFEATKKRIMKVDGVRTVELNYMSFKLRVLYVEGADQDSETLSRIRSAIADHTR